MGMDHADIAQLGGPVGERLQQDGWRGGSAVHEQLLAGPDPGDGVASRNDAHVWSLGRHAVTGAGQASRPLESVWHCPDAR